VLLALGAGLATALVLGVAAGVLLGGTADKDLLDALGKGYASVLELQLLVDLLIGIFAVLTWLWPKGASVARAAFREGYRQPMFWLLSGFAVVFLLFSQFFPYFTFGEDYVMSKELGFDTIMLAAAVFGVIAAASSISEEIEGRTAVTLMSKPVSRRQFLLGKFAGIFLCCLMIVLVTGWFFQHMLIFKRWLDRMDPVSLAPALSGWATRLQLPSEGDGLLRGVLFWVQLAAEVVPGLFMSAALVMILVAVAVSLATRLPMVVNLVITLVVYYLANLAPILVLSTRPGDPAKAGPVQKLLHFTAQTFDTLLPGLELFRVRPTLVDESTLPMGQYMEHVGAVTFYGVLFSAVVLLVGLVLFEDRDIG
jgi:hypothetical protein